MQIKNTTPQNLATYILERSSCTIKVGAVLVDRRGRIFSWGQNHMGFDGFGQCAEAYTLIRANRDRIKGATIYVASMRARNRKVICSKPCPRCQALLKAFGVRAFYRDADSKWKALGSANPLPIERT